MAYRLIVSDFAEASFDAILEYLVESFSDKVVNAFYRETDDIKERLRTHPQQFKKVGGKRNARAGYLNDKVTCYFTILDDQNVVYIYDFFDNRQNPAQLKTILAD